MYKIMRCAEPENTPQSWETAAEFATAPEVTRWLSDPTLKTSPHWYNAGLMVVAPDGTEYFRDDWFFSRPAEELLAN
jgi:hypothetical protein